MHQELSQVITTLASLAIAGMVGLLVRKATSIAEAVNEMGKALAVHVAADAERFDSHAQRLERLEDALN